MGATSATTCRRTAGRYIFTPQTTFYALNRKRCVCDCTEESLQPAMTHSVWNRLMTRWRDNIAPTGNPTLYNQDVLVVCVYVLSEYTLQYFAKCYLILLNFPLFLAFLPFPTQMP